MNTCDHSPENGEAKLAQLFFHLFHVSQQQRCSSVTDFANLPPAQLSGPLLSILAFWMMELPRCSLKRSHILGEFWSREDSRIKRGPQITSRYPLKGQLLLPVVQQAVEEAYRSELRLHHTTVTGPRRWR